MATKSIGSAVGKQPALNSMGDQQTIRDLLMRIEPEDGGPELALPNPIGPNRVTPELQAAIDKFQAQNVPTNYQDGRVDPHGFTLRKMNELARTFSPVGPPQIPTDPVIPPDPPPTPKTTVFYIRMTGSVSGGEVLVGDALFFEMYDPVNYLSVKYKYAGAGVGVGTPATVSGRGPWNKFYLQTARQVSNFGTPFAQFTTVGAGPWTDNFLTLGGLGETVYLDLVTGFDFGGGFSGSVGQFHWYPTTIDSVQYDGLAP